MRRWLVLVVMTLCVLPALGVEAQDERVLRYARWDVDIKNIVTAENRFEVAESYQLVIERGPFRRGQRNVRSETLTAIENVQVYEDGMLLKQVDDCKAETPGTFCPAKEADRYSINYIFSRPATDGERRSIRITYTVRGALRSYSSADRLYWTAMFTGARFPIGEARITVDWPAGLAIFSKTVQPGSWSEKQSGNLITWESPGTMGINVNVELQIRYAHDANMPAPPWQAAFDRTMSGPVEGGLNMPLVMLIATGVISVVVLVIAARKARSVQETDEEAADADLPR